MDKPIEVAQNILYPTNNIYTEMCFFFEIENVALNVCARDLVNCNYPKQLEVVFSWNIHI